MKGVDGSVTTLARIGTNEEMQALLQSWARQEIETFPPDDEVVLDEQANPSNVSILDSEEDIITRSLDRLLASGCSHTPSVNLSQLHYAFSLPPYIHEHQYSIFRKAAEKTGLSKAEAARVGHIDKWIHMSYNSLFCRYHMHPHPDKCTSGSLSRDIFDALVFDYCHDRLTLTWLESVSSLVYRRKALTSSELGTHKTRDREYWLKLERYLNRFLRKIKTEHERRDLTPPEDEVGRNQIVFSGSQGRDHLLRSFLRESLAGTPFDFDSGLVQDDVDPVVVGAHSAATAMKAVIEAPEPVLCEEPDKCVELRESIYKDAKRGEKRDEL